MNTPALVLLTALQGTQDPAAVDQAGPRALMPIPVVVACHRGDRKIDVDGSVVDWPELPPIDLSDVRQLSGARANGAWRSAQDLSAYAFLMWDEHDLWFACVVKDEWHRALDPKTFTLLETPVADSVVLSIDPRRDTRSLGPDPGRADDVEFWLGDEASHQVLQWDRLRGGARLLDGKDESRLVVSHDQERSVTTYEMRVAWSSVLPPGQQPKPGTSFDLQIVVNDFDDGTDPMPQTRIGWTFGCSPLADVCLFGTVILTDADGKLAGVVPDVPQRRKVELPEVLQREHWAEFTQQLRAHPPTVHDGSRAPEEAGGIGRLELLEHLDYEIDRYPRVDFVEFQERAQRYMDREVAAAERHGLPAFWDLGARATAKAAAEPALPGTVRLHRLPQNGWLVRGERLAFLVDPAGGRALPLYGGFADFALLSEPLDMARRSDPLLVDMFGSKPARPFFAHIVFPLPSLLMQDMPLVAPGDERLQSDGARVRALGEQRADGKVPFALGYQVTLPGGFTLVFAGAALRVQDLPRNAANCECLVLTARNPASLAIAAALQPQLVLVDGGFACCQLPDVPRVDLRMLHTMQRLLLPVRSLLLAPGESWTLTKRQ